MPAPIEDEAALAATGTQASDPSMLSMSRKEQARLRDRDRQRKHRSKKKAAMHGASNPHAPSCATCPNPRNTVSKHRAAPRKPNLQELLTRDSGAGPSSSTQSCTPHPSPQLPITPLVSVMECPRTKCSGTGSILWANFNIPVQIQDAGAGPTEPTKPLFHVLENRTSEGCLRNVDHNRDWYQQKGVLGTSAQGCRAPCPSMQLLAPDKDSTPLGEQKSVDQKVEENPSSLLQQLTSCTLD